MAKTLRLRSWGVNPFGLWLLADNEEHFLSFKEFPWFENAPVKAPRELEVLGIFEVIKSVGALDKAVYITARTPSTDHLPAIEAARVLNHFAVKRVFPDWRGFAAIYNEKFEMYPVDCYYSSRWQELSESL